MSFKVVNNKRLFLSFIFFSIGLIIPLFSVRPNTTFWQSLLDIYTNEWYSMMMLLSLSMLVINYYEITSNVNVVIRQINLKDYIDKNTKNLIKTIIIFMLISLIFTITISLILSNLSFETINYFPYNIPFNLYTVFTIVRFMIFMLLFSIIIYYFNWQNITLANITIGVLSILLLFDFNIMINGIPMIVTTLFKPVSFKSFNKEVIYSIYHIILLMLILTISYYTKFNKSQKDKLKWNIKLKL